MTFFLKQRRRLGLLQRETDPGGKNMGEEYEGGGGVVQLLLIYSIDISQSGSVKPFPRARGRIIRLGCGRLRLTSSKKKTLLPKKQKKGKRGGVRRSRVYDGCFYCTHKEHTAIPIT